MQGGMYNILEIIIKIDFEDKTFTKKDLIEELELSIPAITNNLHRLVSIGFLKMEEYRTKEGYRQVKYKLTDEAYKFVNNFIRG